MKKKYNKILYILIFILFLLINANYFNFCYAEEFGVYSETIQGYVLYDHPNANSRSGTYGSSGSTISLSSDSVNKKEGSESMKAIIDVERGGWVGWYIQWGTEWNGETRDMSEYDNGYLIFWVKTPIELKIGIRSNNINPGDEKSKVTLSDYCDGIYNEWQEVRIPMSDFKDEEPELDFTEMKVLFNIARVEKTKKSEFWIDNVRWIISY